MIAGRQAAIRKQSIGGILRKVPVLRGLPVWSVVVVLRLNLATADEVVKYHVLGRGEKGAE